jgi:2-polyprenyl-3-methyl-5-hydroxy-6-metoxy-1,4-benzoquinol methylase
MKSEDPRELEIIRAWHANAAPWSDAIRTASIASRTLVTNQAIVDAVSSVAPKHVLDVGCGEGWLARELADRGIRTTGIDAIPELISQAVSRASTVDPALCPEFFVVDYATIANRHWRGGPFDAAVCNFSLLGADSVEALLGGLRFYLQESGRLIIQTLHPVAACGDLPYRDGWRPGSWSGFSSDFRNPAPWYFRTIESWGELLHRCGFEIADCREPTAAGAVTPASIIWIGRPR